MKARVSRQPDHNRDGYPFLVLISEDTEYWIIDSWHKTKRQAQAVAKDINETEKGNNQ